MSAEQIGSNLALINWTVLAGLAVGSFAVVLLARLRTTATNGYLAFTAFSAAAFGLLAWLSDSGLNPAATGSPVVADPVFDAPRRALMAAFTLAHLSDPHLPPLPEPTAAELSGKRVFGYLNWRRNRHKYHRREVLDALVSDLRAQSPDHIAVTGDLSFPSAQSRKIFCCARRIVSGARSR